MQTINYTTPSNIPPGATIKVQLDPANSLFSEVGSAATSSDIFIGTSTPNGYAVVSSCTSGNQATVAASYNNGTDENITFTICGTSLAIATGTPVQIIVGSSTRLWTNPSVTGSYRIYIAGSQPSYGETRVAVLQNVTLTASVNTSFTFTVSGLATTTGLFGNLSTTTASSTATSLPFATLASGTPVILAQQLNVSTNAQNGFSVTVQEDQPPTSATGATIDLFKDGATTSIPTAWTHPSATLGAPQTYGHFGITSDDVDENSTGVNEFGTGTLWAGNFDQPRVVFSNNGAADGVTQNKGTARVGYKIEISDLQEAGNDYTDTITYVATPTF
jgi:hypothetical protein